MGVRPCSDALVYDINGPCVLEGPFRNDAGKDAAEREPKEEGDFYRSHRDSGKGRWGSISGQAALICREADRAASRYDGGGSAR